MDTPPRFRLGSERTAVGRRCGFAYTAPDGPQRRGQAGAGGPRRGNHRERQVCAGRFLFFSSSLVWAPVFPCAAVQSAEHYGLAR